MRIKNTAHFANPEPTQQSQIWKSPLMASHLANSKLRLTDVRQTYMIQARICLWRMIPEEVVGLRSNEERTTKKGSRA
jgi:hypothetical protein